MNLQELSRVMRINEELSKSNELLNALKSRACSASTPSLSGMPHGSGISQKTELYAIEIADLENRISSLEAEILDAKKSVEVYCAKIDDIRVRLACRFRFLHCLSWKEVADLMGPYYSVTGVKTAVYTYLEKNAK